MFTSVRVVFNWLWCDLTFLAMLDYIASLCICLDCSFVSALPGFHTLSTVQQFFTTKYT